MTPYEWLSCSISFCALIISLPALIHLIKSRMSFKIEIENFKSTQRKDGKFVNSFYLILNNKNETSFTISKIFAKIDKKLEEVKILLGDGNFNINITPNFSNKIEQFYFITDLQVKSEFKFQFITNRRKVAKRAKLDITQN